jgi:hypothetical protein
MRVTGWDMTETDTQSKDDKAAKPKAPEWKVFVSSTGFGLGGFRAVARDVISDFKYAGMRCFKPVMMEGFGAQAAQAREVCAGEMEECDVLVGILGIRYGAHPDDDQTSYTEMEYQTAVRKGLPRLMFLLDEDVARELERDAPGAPQGDDRTDRQQQFRGRVSAELVAELKVRTEQGFRESLTRDLTTWVERYSFTRAMVDHSTEFRDARRRLLDLGKRTGGATLIFGEPGTGKTKLFTTLLNDMPLRHAYDHLAGPFTVRLSGGIDAVDRARAQVSGKLREFAREDGVSGAELRPVLIALFLESGVHSGPDVDPGTLEALGTLFSWDDAPRAVVLAETNNRLVMERLDRDLGWPADAVINVHDYASVDDALEQIRRDAPGVHDWPQPDTRVLAEAVGMRPVTLSAAAKDIASEARLSQKRVPRAIRQQLDAIARDESPAVKIGESPWDKTHRALIRNSIDHLSPEARALLALMTVLHPKPTYFPDEIAVAFDLSLDSDEAISLATAGDDAEPDADGQLHLDTADDLVSELVGRGLLERLAGQDAGPGEQEGGSRQLLTLHPANVRVIHGYLPLTDEQRAEGHNRAEAFFRTLIGETVSGSFDSHFRMETGTWWDDVEEWLYHFGHIAPGRAGIAYAALFLDACWWWDLYVKFDFCDQLLDYARRPRVQAASPDMPEVTRLLAKFRETYPRERESARAETLAKMAGDDPADAPGLRDMISTGAGILPILQELCRVLGLTELDALFSSATATAAAPRHEPDADAPGDEPRPYVTRLHLLGLLCLFLAGGHRFTGYSPGEQGEQALAAAEACYRRAESYFLEEEDAWDVAWTRYLLGEVVSLRHGDPAEVWDEAEDGADEESDTELLVLIERARGDHFWDGGDGGDLEEALRHYGRAVFYGVALQVTSNLEAGADVYTQAIHQEMRLDATRILAEPLLRDQGASPDDRVAEARRRLDVMLGEWGGHWHPEPAALDRVLQPVSREAVESSADAIADAAFPPGPGDAVLGKPGSGYYRMVDGIIENTRSQRWVRGLGRWDKSHNPQPGNP